MCLNLIFYELKLRLLWLSICFCLTWVFCYTFSEELIFFLAKPFLIILKPNKSFISTQLTETLNTYFTTSLLFCFVFCIPYVLYQIWCFLIPSCNQTQREFIGRFCAHSGFAFVCILLVDILCILPQIWHFLYNLSNTSSNVFTIQLQPKIYDFIMLTIRFMSISCVCSQIPVILLCLLEYNYIALQDCTNHRNTVWFCCILLAALLTPPDIWCQLSAFLCICMVIELTLLYALLQFHYHILCSASSIANTAPMRSS